ncbi:hypothetical protein GWD52_07155 [Enterobacteriaceae bacterium 4M9]|nr:hypothetical protein [Enterobacteriaceae bacterium 4M9]
MSISEIPLTADNQHFTVQLGGRWLRFTLLWRDESGWVVDIHSESDEPLISGVPLVTGVDLFEPYRHLGFSGELRVLLDDDATLYPGKTSLGKRSHLLYISA